MSLTEHQTPNTEHLIIHTDGGSRGNPGPAATGIVALSSTGEVVHTFGRYLGEATNNVAEYTAVLDALNWFIKSDFRLSTLGFRLDSQLVVEQLNRRWKIKDANLLQLAMQIWNLIEANYLNVSFAYVPRAQNALADTEVNKVLDIESPHRRIA